MFTDLLNLIFKACEIANTNIFYFALAQFQVFKSLGSNVQWPHSHDTMALPLCHPPTALPHSHGTVAQPHTHMALPLHQGRLSPLKYGGKSPQIISPSLPSPKTGVRGITPRKCLKPYIALGEFQGILHG